MIAIILSLGAINALIPLIIILILIVAAAGLMRGYNIFALFGISALLGGAGKATLAGKNVATKTAGVREGLVTRKKAQALFGISALANLAGKNVATKTAGVREQEYKAAIASGASKADAAKIAYSNARINMMYDKINAFQSSLDKIDSKTNKKVDVALRESLNELKNSSALKNDADMQNLYNSIVSEMNKLSNLASQAKQIQQQLNRTSAAEAKANLDRMRQIQKEYRETSQNLIKDLNKYTLKYDIKGMKEGSVYYISKSVNLVMPNKRIAAKPSALTRSQEQQAHANLHSLSSDLEKSFKKAFKS
ncbi:MAG: hypothetical protein RXO35_03825 [Candidatus Micrarchaeota archaeon]